jgi:hypothetical protein
MSWLFSRALVEEYLEHTYWDGKQFAPSNATLTPQAYLHHDKTTGTWKRFPSGMMCEPLMGMLGEGLLMSFLADFRAKTSAQREEVKGSKESVADYGESSRELSAKSDRAESLLKIPRFCALEDLSPSSKTLPQWGSMQNGVCSELWTLAPHMSEKECGSLLPTPTAKSYGRNNRWPTPQAYSRGMSDSSPGITPLDIAVRPEMQRHAERAKERSRQIRWSTPQAHDYKSEWSSRKTLSKQVDSKKEANGLKLNPTWVEWLMGWPLGWTDLNVLGTDKFRLWQNLHGKF